MCTVHQLAGEGLGSARCKAKLGGHAFRVTVSSGGAPDVRLERQGVET